MRRHYSILALGFAFAVTAACVLQDDFLRAPCSTDGDCDTKMGESCQQTEMGLACVRTGELEIPTLEGAAKIRIPAETQTGKL
ncbi:MAG: hypothetical protein ACK4N5_24980, partial [Myxococcales bacterium]